MSEAFEGMSSLNKKIDKMVDEKTVAEALERACAMVEASAKKNAPKDTGALRRSITSKVENNEGIVFTPLEYAPYIEFGTGLFAEGGGANNPWSYQDDKGEWHTTSGMKPQPFLRPALNENRENIKRILKEAITNG